LNPIGLPRRTESSFFTWFTAAAEWTRDLTNERKQAGRNEFQMLYYPAFELCRGKMPGLNIKSNGSAIRTIQLAPGVNRFGRSSLNDHAIDDPTISGNHCEIIVSDETILVRDLGSTNGTYINGQPVREAVLLHGQTLHLGRVEMSLDMNPVEISIPTFSTAQTLEAFLSDGAPACANHQSSHAVVECKECQKKFCDLCIHQIRRVGGAALILCPSCGGHCQSIVRADAPAGRRKSRIGSWLGGITAKMTGRFSRANTP